MNFSREDVEKSNIDVEVEKNQSTDNEYEITLNLSIANSEEKYTVNVSIVGVFEFSENADEVTKNIIIEKNIIIFDQALLGRIGTVFSETFFQ